MFRMKQLMRTRVPWGSLGRIHPVISAGGTDAADERSPGSARGTSTASSSSKSPRKAEPKLSTSLKLLPKMASKSRTQTSDWTAGSAVNKGKKYTCTKVQISATRASRPRPCASPRQVNRQTVFQATFEIRTPRPTIQRSLECRCRLVGLPDADAHDRRGQQRTWFRFVPSAAGGDCEALRSRGKG